MVLNRPGRRGQLAIDEPRDLFLLPLLLRQAAAPLAAAAALAGLLAQEGRHLGLYLIVTFQYCSTTLYQVSYYIR